MAGIVEMTVATMTMIMMSGDAKYSSLVLPTRNMSMYSLVHFRSFSLYRCCVSGIHFRTVQFMGLGTVWNDNQLVFTNKGFGEGVCMLSLG